jgi:hypothetical protein
MLACLKSSQLKEEVDTTEKSVSKVEDLTLEYGKDQAGNQEVPKDIMTVNGTHTLSMSEMARDKDSTWMENILDITNMTTPTSTGSTL